MKDKFFDFLLIFSIVFLLMTLFFSPEKEDVNQVETIIVESQEKSYTNPNAPIINITNTYKEEVVFNTCDDLEIRESGKVLEVFEGDCRDIAVSSWEIYSFDLGDKYEFFQEESNYSFLLTYWESEYSTSFAVEYKWIINKLFSNLIYKPIFNLTAWLIHITWESLGWWIVLITLVIRLILLVPQHKMMVSQRKMQKIQPKVKEIQQKYKWDAQKMGLELMALYKKENVSPAWACLPLLIQMPILIVVYNILVSIKEPENLTYLYSFLDYFTVDWINSIFFWLELLSSWISLWLVWIILALSVWIIQFIQIKLSFAYNKSSSWSKDWVVLEKKTWDKDYSTPEVPWMPSQDTMNKFMLYVMPVMITWVTLFFPAWLWIYWGLGTLFMIAQQFVVNKVIKT